MAQAINITLADKVLDEIHEHMITDNKNNRSEFIEELIRWGLMVYTDRTKYFKKKGGATK